MLANEMPARCPKHDASMQAEMTDDDWAAMMRDNNVEEVAPPAPTSAAAGPPPGFENAKASSQVVSPQVLAARCACARVAPNGSL